MFDLFENNPETVRKFNESNQSHAAVQIAILMILFEKGFVDSDEWRRALAKATHIVEQEFADKREKAKAEAIEKYPFLRKLLGDGE